MFNLSQCATAKLKQQSFRVGCCLFTNKERNERRKQIIFKTKLIHKARNENRKKMSH